MCPDLGLVTSSVMVKDSLPSKYSLAESSEGFRVPSYLPFSLTLSAGEKEFGSGLFLYSFLESTKGDTIHVFHIPEDQEELTLFKS